MSSEQDISVTAPLPIRMTTARWVLWGYVVITSTGMILHLYIAWYANRPVVWPYVIAMLGILGAGLLSVRLLNRSLSQAMQFITWVGMVCVWGMVIYALRANPQDDISILYMLHINIFALGLILGFKPALQYSIVATLLLLPVGIMFSRRLTEIATLLILAYAVALPSKLVEQLIKESTAKLARINTQLSEEVAERRRAEEDLKHHRDHLEDLVDERTAELAAANQDLAARNEDLDAFGHTVAHDLKNPLVQVIGNAQALEMCYDTLPKHEIEKRLRSIVQSGRRINNILDELMLLAGVRKVEAKSKSLNMTSVVNGALQRLIDMVERSHAEIILPDAWPAAVGHAPWIEEVWVNYISNAIQYGGQPPRLELGADPLLNSFDSAHALPGTPPTPQWGAGQGVSHAPMERGGRAGRDGPPPPPLTSPPQAGGTEGGSFIRFWVRDNGAGIAPEDQAKLFTPFTQLHQIQAKGHGLGLSIVRRIVEKLGGQFGVESANGQGSLFYFTLPAALPGFPDTSAQIAPTLPIASKS